MFETGSLINNQNETFISLVSQGVHAREALSLAHAPHALGTQEVAVTVPRMYCSGARSSIRRLGLIEHLLRALACRNGLEGVDEWETKVCG